MLLEEPWFGVTAKSPSNPRLNAMDNLANSSRYVLQQMAYVQQQEVESIINFLNQCDQEINPAIVLYWELMQKQNSGTLTLEELLLRKSEIQCCQAEGQQQLDAVNAIQTQLNRVSAQPCNPLIVTV
jgi:hypothetical protein